MADIKELIKTHPYATGGVVIVGGLIVFYVLSASQSSAGSSAGTSSATPDPTAWMNYNSQMAQVQAGTEQQQLQANVAEQQNSLAAQVSNYQTAASIETNDTNTAATLAATLAQLQSSTQQNQDTLAAQTTQQANQLMYAQNIQQMQDSVLESQINAGVVENANNNATALAGTQATLDYQGQVAQLQTQVGLAGVQAAETVQTQQQQNQYNLSQQTLNMVQQAGLNHGTESLEANLVGLTSTALGYPQVGVAGVQAGSAASIASSQATANIISSIAGGAAKVGTAYFA